MRVLLFAIIVSLTKAVLCLSVASPRCINYREKKKEMVTIITRDWLIAHFGHFTHQIFSLPLCVVLSPFCNRLSCVFKAHYHNFFSIPLYYRMFYLSICLVCLRETFEVCEQHDGEIDGSLWRRPYVFHGEQLIDIVLIVIVKLHHILSLTRYCVVDDI